MEIKITGKPKEIAALAWKLQKRQPYRGFRYQSEPKFPWERKAKKTCKNEQIEPEGCGNQQNQT